MPQAGFKPATPATKRPQTYALDRAATGIGDPKVQKLRIFRWHSSANLSPGYKNTEAWSSRLGFGREADNLATVKRVLLIIF
jgi:hypothetical protein